MEDEKTCAPDWEQLYRAAENENASFRRRLIELEREVVVLRAVEKTVEMIFGRSLEYDNR